MKNIYVNDIKIGELSDERYKLIRRTVWMNPDTWADQITNIFFCFLKLHIACLNNLPKVLFYLVTAIYIFKPNEFRIIFNTITPIRALEFLAVVFLFLQLFFLFSIFFGNKFGFKNMFEYSRFKYISREFGSAALGEMYIEQKDTE